MEGNIGSMPEWRRASLKEITLTVGTLSESDEVAAAAAAKTIGSSCCGGAN
jgi:hypothetical protein